MKTFTKLSITSLLIVSCLNPLPVQAQMNNLFHDFDLFTQDQLSRDNLTSSVEDYRQAFNLALTKFQKMEDFTVTYRMVDVENQVPLYEGQIDFQGSQGRAAMNFTFNDYDVHDKTKLLASHPLKIMAYDNFNLVYSQQMAWFNSYQILQTYFDIQASQRQALDDLDQIYLISENGRRNEDLSIEDYFSALVLLPDSNLVNQINPSHLTHSQAGYHLQAELTDIPEGLFKRSGNFQLRSNFTYDIQARAIAPMNQQGQLASFDPQASSQKGQWDFSFNHELNLERNEDSLAIDQSLKGPRSSFDEVSQSYQLQDFAADKHLHSSDVTHKLRKIDLTLDPRNNTYHLGLEGIAEDFELNIFEDKTADLKGIKCYLEIDVQPLANPVPDFQDLDRMTAEELKYSLQNIIDKNQEE